ncbi:MAG: hypothetical protein J6Y14_09510 [Fibrobacter sp.]|nr:hypothetical protein [Fibrobacter sp.]
MGVSVAEYFGKRTDIEQPTIAPIVIPDKIGSSIPWGENCPKCPFTSGNDCKKLKSGNQPVCSVRKSDGTLWINCSERLCSTKKDLPLCEHQKNMLLQIGRHIFSPNITENDLCVKREERLSVIEGTNYNADYIITVRSGRSSFSGPDRLILEMQGGGETTNTGVQTAHIKEWISNINRTNSLLRTETGASTLETNAWRRQQEQFIVKGNIAMKTWKGYGIAFCVGTLLYDYLMNKLASANLPDLRQYNWTLALIGIKEKTNEPIHDGPIPLEVDENRLLYTNYQTFVQALINQGEPSLDAFKGDFVNLENQVVNIP